MFKKKLKRILSMFIASAVTAASVCAGAAVLPHNAVPVQAAEMPALVRTYNMVRLDDVLGVKNPSNHNYNPKYDSTYGFRTCCSHGPSDGNYWSTYPASIYGYYDEVIGTWVQTTVKVWANEAYDLDDGHTCSEWPSKIIRYKAMTFPGGESGCHITTRPCDNQLLRGASFVFSDPDNMTGTVTVYYAEECTIVSALNDSFVLSMGGDRQDVTIQNADGSAAQTIYTSRYSNVQFVSSSGYWMSSWTDEDRTITYRNEVYDVSPQRWELLDAGGGYVYIKREGGNGYLTVTGNSAGSVLRSERFNGSDYQKFKIVRTNCMITLNPENGGASVTRVAKYGTGNANTGTGGITNGTYEFMGWYTGKNGTGERVYDASGNAVKGTYWSDNGAKALFTSTAEYVELYAYWLPGKITQTLKFYKDGAYKMSRTYAVRNGSVFDAASHTGDVSDEPAFAHTHYSSISRSSWTVSTEASADVYYVYDTLKIVYDANGADGGAVSGADVMYGQAYAAVANGFTRTGYSFDAWNTKSDGMGTTYKPGDKFTAAPSKNGEELRLYAIWSRKSYTVTLNAGTGIQSVSGAGTYRYEDSVSISAIPAQGYDRIAWSGESTSDGRQLSFNMPAHDVTYTAQAQACTYTVSFDGGAGVTDMTSVTVTYDADINKNITGTNTRDGYVFGGWNTSPDGTGEYVWNDKGESTGAYWKDGVWKYPDNLTVYAVWLDRIPPALTVSGEGTDGWVHSVSITISAEDNESGLWADNEYVYSLSDSETETDGEWKRYTPGQGFVMGGELTGIYYLHVKAVYDNQKNPSDGSGGHVYGPYLFDNEGPDLSAVMNNYGWYTGASDISFAVADAQSGIKSVIISDFNGVPVADITQGLTHTFDTDGTNFYYITALDKLDNVTKKAFVVKTDRGGELIPDNAVWKGLSDLRVHAVWQAVSYRIVFDGNEAYGGSTHVTGTMEPINAVYDKDYTLTENAFIREGYEFTGWNTSPDGTGTGYADKAVVRNLSAQAGTDAVLYAQWKPLKSTLVFDYNKPLNSSHDMEGNDVTQKDVMYGQEIGALPEPSIEGWVFTGWYVDGDKVTEDTAWKYREGKTAVAGWRAVIYTVRLHLKKPDDAMSDIVKTQPDGWTWSDEGYYGAVFTYDEESTIPSADGTCSLTEYEIGGWYADIKCTSLTGDGTRVWNLISADNGIVDLYASYEDATGPRITLTPVCSDGIVHSVDIRGTIDELGSGLAANNVYELGLSKSASVRPDEWTAYSETDLAEGFSFSLDGIGSSLDGYYYIWVRRISDRSGNKSTSNANIGDVGAFHVYGVYIFDNMAPAGRVRYVENNGTLGLYDEEITQAPYAVMTIMGASDNLAGIKECRLVISDAGNADNSHTFEFTRNDDGSYECVFDMYDCLYNPQAVERVRMQVEAYDSVGNMSYLPIMQWDFGTLQTGEPIQAEDIGYTAVKDGEDGEYIYERDAFRVEAYVSSMDGTVQFKAGQKGILRIYTFGYVSSVSADFGSVMNFYNAKYDTNPELTVTDIPVMHTYMYRHAFKIPVYCPNSLFTDTRARGYKAGGRERRYVVYEVTGRIIDDIRTILKYRKY